MANTSDVKRLIEDLHARKILNADISVRELLAVNADHLTNPGSLVGWYALGGDHYVVVCGKNPIGTVSNPGPMGQQSHQ